MNTQIIAIANQKGGVGKTTTCANLGIGLAQAGKKVLLIDGDPQGSLTISLGHPQPDKLPFTLSDAMGRILMDEPLRPGEGILHHPEGVDLMPADIQLSGMEVSLVNAMSRETILRQYLDTLKGQYSHMQTVSGALEGGTEMKILKCLLMIVTAPVILALTLFVWLCTGLIYISGLVLGLLSTVIALLGVAVLITYSPQNGAILLVMAFLISPMGLPLAAIWLLGKVQSLKFAIQDWVYG